MSDTPFLTFTVLTPRVMTGSPEAADFLGLIEQYFPAHLPEFYNCEDPINIPYVSSTRETIRHSDEGMWFFTRQNPAMTGSIFSRINARRQTHANVRCSITPDGVNERDCVSLLTTLAASLKADFAFLSLITMDDCRSGKQKGFASRHKGAIIPWSYNVSTQHLERGLPEVFWLTVFGPPYINLLGESKLLAAPAYKTFQVDERSILVQLTEAFDDPVNNPQGWEVARERFRQYLGTEAFMKVNGSPASILPEFRFTDLTLSQELNEYQDDRYSPATIGVNGKGRWRDMEYVDTALAELAEMLLELPLEGYLREGTELCVDRGTLNYSVASLDPLDKYLRSLQLSKVNEGDLSKLILRAGAYVGEVTRRINPHLHWHWIDYQTAVRLNKPAMLSIPELLESCAILGVSSDFLCFPVAKVAKIIDGDEANLTYFAEVTSSLASLGMSRIAW